ALGEAAFRKEDLVEIGEFQDALAAADLGLDRQFAAHLLGLLVLAKPLVGGSAKPAVVGPFGELDLADELRLDPEDVVAAHLRHLRGKAEGGGFPPPRLLIAEAAA